MKKCSKCKIDRDLSDFYKDKSRKDGLRNICRGCDKNKINKYRLENPDKVRQYKIDNSEALRQIARQYAKSKKDGLHYVYLLPEERWVGTTNNLYQRMAKHRFSGRNPSNYQILASFEDRGEALELERKMHDQGYRGRHKLNVYK